MNVRNNYGWQSSSSIPIRYDTMCAVICVSIQDLWAGGMNVRLLLKSDSSMCINPHHVTVLCDHRMPVSCARSIGQTDRQTVNCVGDPLAFLSHIRGRLVLLGSALDGPTVCMRNWTYIHPRGQSLPPKFALPPYIVIITRMPRAVA